jgi:hypothetical protein
VERSEIREHQAGLINRQTALRKAG